MNESSRLKSNLLVFHERCDYYLKTYYDIIKLFNEGTNRNPLFTKDIRNMLIDYSLLCLYSSWENFLQNVFIAYMLGEKSTSGETVHVFVNPIDEDHAYRLIKSTNLYPDWTDIEKVLTNAYNFFEDSGPFKLLITMRTELNSLKKIRNNIAHSSTKALQDFQNLVRGTIGYLPSDISTAVYLLDSGPKNITPKCTYFEYYLNYLKNASVMIVEFKK